MRRHSQKGFSLMELLVALFVFSLLTAFAFRATNALSRSGEALELEQRSLMELQKVVHFIENDLKRLGLPSTEAENDDPFANSDSLNGEQDENSRINLGGGTAYYIEEGVLYRESGISDDNKQVLKMLDEVDAITLNAVGSEADQNLGNTSLIENASGIEFSLQHKQFGLIRRVIYLGLGQVTDNEFADLKGRLPTPSETAETNPNFDPNAPENQPASEEDLNAVLGL